MSSRAIPGCTGKTCVHRNTQCLNMSKHAWCSLVQSEEEAAPWGKSPLRLEGIGFGMSRFALWKNLRLSLWCVQGQNQTVNKGKIWFGFSFFVSFFKQ